MSSFISGIFPDHIVVPARGFLVKEVSQKVAMLVLNPTPLVPNFVLYIDIYDIDKTWCEYKPNQNMDYAVKNPVLITTNITVIKAVLI